MVKYILRDVCPSKKRVSILKLKKLVSIWADL